jgi:hypothetical protein
MSEKEFSCFDELKLELILQIEKLRVNTAKQQ